jgi:4-diphosphocytidyl-2-C-methyl-D-erythritol kinase
MVKLLAGRTPAKINLFLRVTGRRADGYHELDSVFLPISMYDRISVEVRDAGAGEDASVALRCSAPGLPADQDNLAVRAAHAFMREFAIRAEVLIDLDKHIPAGAGLGGGSSDAAAVLRMMAALRPAGGDGAERMGELAASIGADVPFFLAPAPSRVRGIGERIAPLGDVPALPLVIAVPPFEVATASVFRALEPSGWSGPAPDGDLEALAAGEIRPSLTVNDLAAPATSMFPEISRLRSLLAALGARAAQMSGSGGAVFGVFESAEEARQAASEMRRRAVFARIFACETLTGAPPDI